MNKVGQYTFILKAQWWQLELRKGTRNCNLNLWIYNKVTNPSEKRCKVTANSRIKETKEKTL